MNVLVTGGTGFIGSHTVDVLVERGADVTVLYRPESDLDRIEHRLEDFQLVETDLENLEAAEPEIASVDPDVICHSAWKGVPGSDRNDPEQTDNIRYSLDLLELAADVGCDAWIGLGSQAEYGPKNERLDETATPEPTTLYGATKLATFRIASKLCELHAMRFAWLRIFSCYGPRNSNDWFVQYLARALLRGEEPEMTEGTQVWDYLYVTDLAEAVAEAAMNPAVEGPYNIGSGNPVTIREVARTMRDLVDPDRELHFGEVPYRDDQVMHLQADPSRFQTDTGWKPTVGLEDGLQRTLDWVRNHATISA